MQQKVKKIVNIVKKSDVTNNILDKFLFSNLVTFTVVFLGPLLSIITFLAFSIIEESSRPELLSAIIILDFLYILIVGVLILFKVSKVLANQRARRGGSSLHLRVTSVFSILALSPAIIVAVFATISLNFGLEDWFSEKVQRVVGNSLESARAYKMEHTKSLKNDAFWMSKVLSAEKQFRPFLSDGDLRKILNVNQQEGISKSFLINYSGELKVRGDRSYLFDFKPVKDYDILVAKNEGIAVIEDLENNEFRAIVSMEAFPDRLLYLTRNVDGEVLALLDQTKETVILYDKIEKERGQLLFEFGQLYLGFSIVLILSAVWFALWIAERLTRPVSSLVTAVAKVADGDFTVEVSEEKGRDEVAILGRVFNKMTRQIKKQRDSLLSINSKTEEKKRQFEAVLDGASGGIIGTNAGGIVEVINIAAEKILGLSDNEGLTKNLKDIAPEFIPLFNKAMFLDGGSLEEEVEIFRESIKEKIFLKISIIKSEEGQLEGYVFTFDDLTDLVAAQRSAAWGDVARRVAHEVKNPLTPIKLAAERLKKYFLSLNEKDKVSASEYANMIIRQTESLSRLVTEFSNFSRLPLPKKVELDLCKLTESAILLQKVAYKDIIFKFRKSEDCIFILGDGQMLNQAFLNLIKNSIESIDSAKDAALIDINKSYGQVEVDIRSQNDEVCVTILDNGIGLPKNVNRLFEPYVTIKKEGTGLGLSIVKKIIEDHLGSLFLMPGRKMKGCDHFGAEAKIILPIINSKKLKHDSRLSLKEETK